MTPWTCEVCGEHDNNRESWNQCVHCNRRRGTWVCRWDGAKNCETAKACRVCGHKKGTAPPDHSG